VHKFPTNAEKIAQNSASCYVVFPCTFLRDVGTSLSFVSTNGNLAKQTKDQNRDPTHHVALTNNKSVNKVQEQTKFKRANKPNPLTTNKTKGVRATKIKELRFCPQLQLFFAHTHTRTDAGLHM
jgi:hypothetical protein